MTRRALLRLLSLLPFAPLLRLAPAAAAAPVRVKQYASYVVRHPKAAALGIGYGMNPERALRVYGGSVEVPWMAVPAAEQFIERQRQREAAWAAELYRDGVR